MHSPDFLFPRFLVFPPAILAIFHIANVFLSGFPLFFSTEVLYFVRSIMKCVSGTSRSSIDEKTGKMRRHAGLIINS